MVTTYGIISDLHSADIDIVYPAIQILREVGEDIDALVLNGDLFGERSGYNPQRYFATLLDTAGRSGLETYVVLGSHEIVNLAEPVLELFCRMYGNIVNTLQYPYIEKDDYSLAFLSGSDVGAGEALSRGYMLVEDEHIPSGEYHSTGRDKIMVTNMHSLKRMVSDPEKTIVFSHVPRRFSHVETGIDMAEFWEAMEGFSFGDAKVEAGAIFPGPVGKRLAPLGVPLRYKKENRGNETLKAIFETIGISKAVNGHFHESAGRAHDQEERPVEDSVFVPSLFYNASCLDRGLVGLLSVAEEKVAYENINLRDHLRVGRD